MCRFKNVVSIYNGNSIPDSEKIKYEDPINAYPYISSKDIDVTFSTANYENGMFTKKGDENFKIAKAGSVLMCIEGGSAGRKKVLLQKDVSFVNKLACFAPVTINGKYLFYYLLSPNFEEHFLQNLTGLIGGVSVSTLRNMSILVPMNREQEVISAYLDKKCAAIDAAVAEAKRGIEEYKMWKKSLIFEAVTGKIAAGGSRSCATVSATTDAQTDARERVPPARPMRDSGIPWLGTVPEGWEIVRAKQLFHKEQRPTRADDEIVTAFRDGEVTLRKNRRLTGFTEATDYSHYQGVRKGDLVIHQMDAFAGCVGVSDSDGMGSPILSVCTPKNHELCNVYYAKLIRMMGLTGYIASLAKGVRERSADFRFETFAKELLPLPPIAEQRAIADYLDEKCAAIDALVAEKEALIADLETYKKSLIYEVVTGKKEVRQNEEDRIGK